MSFAEEAMDSERLDGDMSRRTLVGAAAATVVATGTAAQPASRPKGPRVWLDMDQAELDDAYNQAAYAPNREQLGKRRASLSEGVRGRLGAPRRLAYAPSAIEMLDVYATPKPNAPVAVFVHGGAWRGNNAKDSAYGAETFVRAGAHFVVLDFINVLESGGDLMPMAEQVRRGIAFVAKNAASLGGDPDSVYVVGHSSGAHLGGCALITDWRKDFDLPPDVVKGATLCSGMYDLEPARLSARSNYVKFTDATEDVLSTQRHLARIACPVTLVYGTLETPEFQRQSRDFAAALKAAGKPVQLIVADGYNHFEVGETLNNPYGPFGRAALDMMRLGVG
jgi:arylformamidase